MSDFESDPSVPPQPPSSSYPPAPPGAPAAPFGSPTGPPPSYAQPGYNPVGYPPAYAPVTGMMQKPPRPKVAIGSLILIIGGVLMIVGCFLNWFTVDGRKFDGFAGDEGETKDGPVFVFLAVLSIGFGIAQLAARKVLAVAILAVVFASFAVLAAIADLSDVSDLMDLADAFGEDASTGPGLYVILGGSLMTLAGGIATLSRRRSWPAQT